MYLGFFSMAYNDRNETDSVLEPPYPPRIAFTVLPWLCSSSIAHRTSSALHSNQSLDIAYPAIRFAKQSTDHDIR